MTVADLIAELQALPQDLPIVVNDEDGGKFFEKIDFIYRAMPDPAYPEDQECVVLVVNECV